MKFGAYREVMATPLVRTIIVLGMLARIGQFGFGVLLTVHLVQSMGYSYSRAGIVTAVWTIGLAISAPWRGALLDRVGLRRTMLPSLIIVTPVLILMPFVHQFWLLLVLAAISGLAQFPTFSVIRQAVIAATPVSLRRTAISLDSTIVEVCFMAGPAVAIWLGTAWSTTWGLLLFGALTAGGALVMTVLNPPILSPDEATASHAGSDQAESPVVGLRQRFSWVTPQVIGVLLAGAVGGFILSGTDLAVVAALRELGALHLTGMTLAIWGLGSACAGLAYGGLHRPAPVIGLVLGLGATTALVSLASSVLTLNLLLLLAGVFCAPTLVAAQDQLQRSVDAKVRGQALGWQGSFMTAGNTMAPPLVGLAMDLRGWQSGFLLAGMVGLVASLLLIGTQRWRRRRVRVIAS